MYDVAMDLADIIKPHVGKTGGLITALRDVQRAIGRLPPETEEVAAGLFNLTMAEVKGVISFYADFHREPKGKTVIRLCMAEACQASGVRDVCESLEKKFALKLGETNSAKELTLEPVYCLGLCSVGPAALVDEKLIGRADAKNIEDAVYRRQREKADG